MRVLATSVVVSGGFLLKIKTGEKSLSSLFQQELNA